MSTGVDGSALPQTWSVASYPARVTLGVVVTAADQNYVAQVCVMAHSLAKSQVHRLRLIVLGTGWNSASLTDLRRAAGESIDVMLVEPDDPRTQNFSNSGYGFPPAATYSVLAAGLEDLDGVERFVYMDADVLVMEDLEPLFRMTLDRPVGAVVDAHVSLNGMPSMWRPWREELVDPMSPYLNTGVMVIDRERWMSAGITERVFDLLGRYDLPCVDQDALNLVLGGSFHRLAPRWNLMPYHLMRLLRTSDLVERDVDIAEAITRPAVVHYHRSFLGKPWQIGCTHPARAAWREVAAELGFSRRSLSLRDVVRNFGASRVGMSVLDSRAAQLESLRIAD